MSRMVQQVRSAVESVVNDPAGLELDLDEYQRVVSGGCPHGYVPAPADAARDPATRALRGNVPEPSTFSTFVFVVGPTESERLGATGYARAPYENLCDGEVCAESSTALFITSEVLNSPPLLKQALTVGLGVDPAGGASPDGHPPEWEFTK